MPPVKYTRYNPKPIDRAPRLTPRDILLFEKLHRHGPLTSAALKLFSHALTKNDDRTKKRLLKLSSPTADTKSYLSRPDWQPRDASLLVAHDLTPLGKEVLDEQGLLRAYPPAHARGRQAKHDFMSAHFTSSVELGLPPQHQFIYHDEICDKLGGPLEFKIGKRTLKPDRAFGIKYPDGSVRRFLIEADMGTEQNASAFGRKTTEDNLKLYEEFIGTGMFRDAMHVTGPVMLLYLMNSKGRIQSFKRMVEKVFQGGCNYIAFKHIAGFGMHLKPPPPAPEFFTDPYERAGRPDFYMNK